MDEREKIKAFFESKLINGYEINSINYPYTYFNDKGMTEKNKDVLWVKLKKPEQDICVIELNIDLNNRDFLYLSLDQNTLKNFREIFHNANDIINDMVGFSNDIAFIYAYCLGINYKIELPENLEDLIIYDGTEKKYKLEMNINESYLRIQSFIDLQEYEFKHDLEIFVSINNDINKNNYFPSLDEDSTVFRKAVLLEWAAKPLEKDLSMLQMEDYKVLPMIYC